MIHEANRQLREAQGEIREAERWLRVATVCRRLDVRPRTVYRWIEAGKLGKSARQLPSGHWRVKESALSDLLRVDL